MPTDQLAPVATRPTSQEWWQAYIEFPDVVPNEQAAVRHLAPLLDQARENGWITGWWFIRKHPCWRVRLRLGPAGRGLHAAMGTALDELTNGGVILRWWPGIYEAEEAAFGGPAGMMIAHDLFTADSQAIMGLVEGTRISLGRRELSIVMCTALLRGAGLEWYEQGDAWHRVARERPLPADAPAAKITEMAATIRTLLVSDTSADSELFQPGGPMATNTNWAAAFRQAGQQLGAQARCGGLQRGLREVLSYHVIFHWNRLGLPARQQAILAWSAREAILGPIPATIPQPGARRSAAPARDLGHIAKRFPLIPRPRLACPGLETRIRQVRQYATLDDHAASLDERIDQACTALNQAALIAADCGMPDLAAELCERQFAIFQSAWPRAGQIAIAALQPLVNLARLDIRDGRPDRAGQALTELSHVVRHGGTVSVRGKSFTLDGMTATGTNPVGAWLRDVLLHDGTRALTAAGQWDQAAAHAAQYDASPDRLHDSRQARVISHIKAGDATTTLALIADRTRTEPWEQAVATCLRTYARLQTECAIPDGTISALNAVRYALQPPSPGTALFQVRLSLTAAELAAAIDPAELHRISQVADDALQASDACAAREILMTPGARELLTTELRQRLLVITAASGLGAEAIPQPLHHDLLASVTSAEGHLRALVHGSVYPV
jgi:thiopeptide-type bacteriocin biosynthesis protein